MNRKTKYIPKTKKKKLNFEKKIMIQASVSLILGVYCAFISGVNYFPRHKQFLSRAVNITWNIQDIKNACSDAVFIYRAIADKGEELLFSVLHNTDVIKSPEAVGEPASAHINEQPSDDNPSEEIQTEPSSPGTNDSTVQSPSFRYPANGEITSPFGSREHPINGHKSVHYGIDIAANYGDCVISALPGTVTGAGYDANLGNYVKVRHSDTIETVYGHLSEILVKSGEVVDGNTRIGSAGSSGAATGPHVHFEIRENGICQNPLLYLPKN